MLLPLSQSANVNRERDTNVYASSDVDGDVRLNERANRIL